MDIKGHILLTGAGKCKLDKTQAKGDLQSVSAVKNSDTCSFWLVDALCKWETVSYRDEESPENTLDQ